MKRTRVKDLKPGDRVDLENDIYADPNHDKVLLEHEYMVVDWLERESPGCVCVYFQDFTCGFPPNHVVNVQEQEGTAK